MDNAWLVGVLKSIIIFHFLTFGSIFFLENIYVIVLSL